MKKNNKLDQIIENLNGKKINDQKIRVFNLRMGRFVEERDFELFMEDKNGHISRYPIIYGKYFGGRGKWYPVWLEITYRPIFNIGGKKKNDRQLQLEANQEDVLFRYLSELIPNGGRIFVMYTTAGLETIKSIFERSIPPMLTDLGFLLWKNGFRWFKDWYYAEGWLEGGQKLQANKPLNEEIRYKREVETIVQINNFLLSKQGNNIIRKRAEYILKNIKKFWCQ